MSGESFDGLRVGDALQKFGLKWAPKSVLKSDQDNLAILELFIKFSDKFHLILVPITNNLMPCYSCDNIEC